MASHILKVLGRFENKVKYQLENYPKYPNKLQVIASIYFFKCFPFLPRSPVSWCSKNRSLVSLKNKFQTFLYLTWVFVFEFLVGLVSPCYLLWKEFANTPINGVDIKMGMKTSTFQILFAVGTFMSVCYSIFTWTIPANDICLDYKIVSNFANYLHHGRCLIYFKRSHNRIRFYCFQNYFFIFKFVAGKLSPES